MSGAGCNRQALADGALYQTVDRLIYAFHMPLFFFVSGLFFEGALRRGMGEFLRRSWGAILWPMTLWTWIYFGFKAGAGSLANTPVPWSEFPLLPLPPREQFWFFWALFLLHLGSYVLLRPLSARGRVQGALRLAFWVGATALVLVPTGAQGAVWIGAALRNAGFFALGLALVPTLLQRQGRIGLGGALAGLGLFAAAEILALVTPSGPVANILPASAAVLGLVWFCRALPDLPVLQRLGQASAAIYVAHVIFAAALRIVLIKLGVKDLSLHLVAGTAIGILGPLGLQMAVGRVPVLARFAGLGRG